MAKGSRVVYKGGSGKGDPVTQFALFYEKVADRHAEAVAEAARDGEALMKELIESRGTGKSWVRDYGDLPHGTPGRTASSPGRVASGQMRDAVSSSATVSKKGNSVVRFGWLGGDREDYFLFQEGGFNHVQAGITVEGMYALQDARDEIISGLKKRLADGA